VATLEFEIAIIGGTGVLGRAIARRLIKAGKRVMLGSRSADKAAGAAAELSTEFHQPVGSGTNAVAAQSAPLVLVTTPYASQAGTLAEIAPYVRGKIVVDTTVPLVPPKVMRVQMPAEGCAAAAAQKLLGPEVRVVSAFHNVAAHKLAQDLPVDCDVLVFGDDKASRQTVIGLVEACGLRGLHGGALVNSAAAEALTSVLIFLNRTYSVDGAGLRITGDLKEPSP
jgi:8-hydroxy-5-deazaflavin:NADPH oxidoreductase